MGCGELGRQARETESAQPGRGDAGRKPSLLSAAAPEEAVQLVGGAAELPWEDATPHAARRPLHQADTSLEVDVLDLRPPAEISKDAAAGDRPDACGHATEAFLLQRYGGPVVDADSIPGLGDVRRMVGAAPPADYSVQAWLDARAGFGGRRCVAGRARRGGGRARDARARAAGWRSAESDSTPGAKDLPLLWSLKSCSGASQRNRDGRFSDRRT